MNNKRRQKLDACKWLLSSISSEAQDVGEQLDSILNLKSKLDEWSSQTNLTLERLQAILDEENGALMSIPDNFLDGTVCYNVETAVTDIETAIEETKKILDLIDEVEDKFNMLPLRQINYGPFKEALNGLDAVVETAQEYIVDAKGI